MEDAMIDKRQFYINGEWVNPATPRDCMVIDPLSFHWATHGFTPLTMGADHRVCDMKVMKVPS